MPKTIVPDSGPLGLLSYSKANDEAESCHEWLREHLAFGTTFIIPEIADYEVRRELLRLRLTKGLIKLESLRTVHGVQYLPITTENMRVAAQFWATTRQQGRSTSDDKSLDGDVILAAQVVGLGHAGAVEVITVSTNVAHIRPFVPAARWREVDPRP